MILRTAHGEGQIHSSSASSLVASLLLASICFFALTAPTASHFLLNQNVRVIHVEHINKGADLYVRIPMPYLVAGLVGPSQIDGLPAPAPFTFNRMEEGRLVHLVDFDALLKDANGLGKLAAEGFRLTSGDSNIPLAIQETRIYRVGAQPPFATLEEARASFVGNSDMSDPLEDLYVGDTIVDAKLHVRSPVRLSTYQLASSLDPGLPDQDRTANLILDYGPDGTKVFRSEGLMTEPVSVSRSTLAAIWTFVVEGIRHILEGPDHVLFVLCLVLGARSLSSLAWRVTGFTLGHSVTLTAGFFGFVPQGPWFIPLVETSIAASIIYAAAIAVWPSRSGTRSEKTMLLITGGIGLLHGLGFSFVLKNILQVTSPDIWQSLLAFNLGVEIGQLAIVLVLWPALWLLAREHAQVASVARATIALGCGSIATYWTASRLQDVVSAI